MAARLKVSNSSARRALLAQCGFDELKLDHHADDAAKLRKLSRLVQLEPAMLSQHAGAVVSMFEDPEEHVRAQALCVMCRLDPATLAPRAPPTAAVVAFLDSSDVIMRLAALKVLEKLEPAAVAQHVQQAQSPAGHLI